MTTLRIIKKYSNRRLYDTAISKYITLDEIKDLVVQKVKFQIIDNATDEDMTNYVLLQIISEGENGSTPIFTTEILQNIIRFYNSPMQKTARDFIEKSFSALSNAQEEAKNFLQNNTLIDSMTDFAKRNMEFWQKTTAKEKTSSKSKTKAKKPRTKKPKS